VITGERNIYIPIIKPLENPAAFANDACFGLADPGDDPDTYDEIDSERNNLEQIPCLTKDGDGKLWWSSVWLYPRAEWPWADEKEEEITFAYNWPIEGWMKADAPNGGGEAPFSDADGSGVASGGASGGGGGGGGGGAAAATAAAAAAAASGGAASGGGSGADAAASGGAASGGGQGVLKEVEQPAAKKANTNEHY